MRARAMKMGRVDLDTFMFYRIKLQASSLKLQIFYSSKSFSFMLNACTLFHFNFYHSGNQAVRQSGSQAIKRVPESMECGKSKYFLLKE